MLGASEHALMQGVQVATVTRGLLPGWDLFKKPNMVMAKMVPTCVWITSLEVKSSLSLFAVLMRMCMELWGEPPPSPENSAFRRRGP